MSDSSSQTFLKELDKKLWTADHKLNPLVEGRKGGQYFTPKSVVSLIVEMIEPYQGRVYDPAMGSGGFFVQSERFIEEQGGTIGDIMVFGQDQSAWGAHLRRAQRARRLRLRRKQPNQSNPTTWRLAAMNMAIRGIDFDFGKKLADTFTRDQHPDLRADFVMANPPFNIKEWWDGKLEGDGCWKCGTPPQGNAEFPGSSTCSTISRRMVQWRCCSSMAR